jgi:hypothetical protein
MDLKQLRERLYPYAQHITHLAVAHTHFKTTDASTELLDWQIKRAKTQCRFFLNRFNQVLYGAKSKTFQSSHRPLVITTLEGSIAGKSNKNTLHYNFLIGNVPECLTTEELRTVFTHCWSKAGFSTHSIWLEKAGTPEYTEGFINYCTKEAQLGNLETVDWENSQFPKLAP